MSKPTMKNYIENLKDGIRHDKGILESRVGYTDDQLAKVEADLNSNTAKLEMLTGKEYMILRRGDKLIARGTLAELIEQAEKADMIDSLDPWATYEEIADEFEYNGLYLTEA